MIMIRLFKHEWEKLTGTGKLKHQKCKKCGVEKYWDQTMGRMVYSDIRHGIYYRSLGCTS